MTKQLQLSVLILVVGLLALGCRQKPQMKVADVIQVANQAAQNAGYRLADYQDPEVHFEFIRKDHTWSVFYVQKPVEGFVSFGSDFLVLVDDRTRRTEVFRGK